MIIAVVQAKGGSGKTTLAVNVAACLGDGCVLIDNDPQRSAQKWADAAEDNPLPCSVVSYIGDQVGDAIRKMAGKYEDVVIDTAAGSAARRALAVADIALVPCVPSPLDIRATMPVKQMIEDVNQVRQEPLRALVLANRVKARTRFAAEAADALASLGMPVADVQIRDRQCHLHCALDGQSVFDVNTVPGRAAADEIRALVAEIRNTVR
jgi:chromosome partitioning protein